METAYIQKISSSVESSAAVRADGNGLQTEPAVCCICDTNHNSEQIAAGEDFEYRTSSDEFSAFFCRQCRLVYLNPRPVFKEFERIYPPNYHAFEFSEKEFGFVFTVRRRLEAGRLLSWCKNLPDDARIIDIGCGDGFHLELLRDFGKSSWTLVGVDADARAASMAEKKGLKVHCGLLENLNLPTETYDLAIMIQTIEHVAEPASLLRDVRSILKPGGRVVIVTDNIDSPDFRLFKKRHWGGYHFPRHWNLFSPSAIENLAEKTEMKVETQTTQVSPVNWTYSIRNYLTDRKAPLWLIDRFSLKSTLALGVFTIFDAFHNFFGRGALINAILKRPF
jgi:SAM-dependent methyltransferase